MDLSKLFIIVTGAGGGIGRAMAVGFAGDGATILGFGRNARMLEETQALCPPGRMSFVVGDLASSSDTRALFTEASRRMGRVDVLINNAARYPKTAFLDAPFEDWNHAVTTNVIGTAHCCYLALPGMLERRFGRIVNVGTFAWLGPIPDSSAYSASKGAIRPLTQALASEVDPTLYPDVLINEFIPGVFRTGMSDSGEAPDSVYPHIRHVVTRPSGSPTGKTYFKSDLLQDDVGLRTRVKRMLTRLLPRRSR